MRIATWNVNSIRSRVDRVVSWMVREDVDVLAMQEIKCKPEQFPHAPFEAAGYEVVLHGFSQWNGVAIASRLPIDDVQVGFTGMPGFSKDGINPEQEARALGATVNDVRVWSLYVPNGRSLEDPHYEYKLEWLDQLRNFTESELAAKPEQMLALMGDFNVCPTDNDNGDPTLVTGLTTHVSDRERAAFFALEEAGMVDVVRPRIPEGFTYWDYQQLRFPRNEGLRIDFILGNGAFAEVVVDASIHRNERKGEAPSDHVPVMVELDLEAEDSQRSMVFG